jgi:hypothetical protein
MYMVKCPGGSNGSLKDVEDYENVNVSNVGRKAEIETVKAYE